ncbi:MULTISPECIES: pyridoxamine 5'-phosphate oxidase family protein [Nocardioides]|uniref:Pyridoxamine 5'-phosphate oxidase family protein n=1 Tax=Nocardioides vastitatis TaxID=2568655 RepID=A0ABW0ZMM8_9ACTN|nr:pyridoxamine 5'-phosphate oxidase family protein [Nocardioides sp.]THJ05728.1 pyridoxamine 5'-phosphate oxidase family protein [Nocardioides sp.]
MSDTTVAKAINASSLAELSWLDPAGDPQVRGVVALVRRDQPALAFTYAAESVARQVASSSTLVLALREIRSTGTGFRPVLIEGTPRLLEDPSGDLFVADLLAQELRRFPPSRLLADSLLLMREHWWYLPRLVVEIDVASIRPVPARDDSTSHLLVVANRDRPEVAVARLRQDHDDVLTLDVVGPVPDAGPAVLFGQDASFPDLERWSQWQYRGRWDGTAFRVLDAPARPGLGPVPGVLQRWRRQRALERRCIEALRRA